MDNKIIEISFKKINGELYLYIYYDDEEIKKIKVKKEYKDNILYLVMNIYLDDILGGKI